MIKHFSVYYNFSQSMCELVSNYADVLTRVEKFFRATYYFLKLVTAITKPSKINWLRPLPLVFIVKNYLARDKNSLFRKNKEKCGAFIWKMLMCFNPILFELKIEKEIAKQFVTKCE